MEKGSLHKVTFLLYIRGVGLRPLPACRVDGLHQEDLANYVAEFPNSNIAALASTGVTYNNLFLPAPSDSWPALAHHVTGAGPAQHGIIYGKHRPLITSISCLAKS